MNWVGKKQKALKKVRIPTGAQHQWHSCDSKKWSLLQQPSCHMQEQSIVYIMWITCCDAVIHVFSKAVIKVIFIVFLVLFAYTAEARMRANTQNVQQGEQEIRGAGEGRTSSVEQRHEICGMERDGVGYTGETRWTLQGLSGPYTTRNLKEVGLQWINGGRTDCGFGWWWTAVLKTWREEWDWREWGSLFQRWGKRGMKEWRWAVILDFGSFNRRRLLADRECRPQLLAYLNSHII